MQEERINTLLTYVRDNGYNSSNSGYKLKEKMNRIEGEIAHMPLFLLKAWMTVYFKQMFTYLSKIYSHPITCRFLTRNSAKYAGRNGMCAGTAREDPTPNNGWL